EIAHVERADLDRRRRVSVAVGLDLHPAKAAELPLDAVVNAVPIARARRGRASGEPIDEAQLRHDLYWERQVAVPGRARPRVGGAQRGARRICDLGKAAEPVVDMTEQIRFAGGADVEEAVAGRAAAPVCGAPQHPARPGAKEVAQLDGVR